MDKQIKSAGVYTISNYNKLVMSQKQQEGPITRKKSPLSRSTTEFFQTQSALNNFISQFFLPKQHDYSQNILEFYCKTHNFAQKNHLISNKQNESLYTTVFYKSKLQKPPQNCIVYCHGFGSTRLEAVHILKVLSEQIALCCFDFSGAGKSQGNITTYGAKEKEDIHSVLNYLKQNLRFKHFILWGRSMGATASLLYSIKYEQAEELLDQTVVFQIVDSPFYSFQRISLELAKKFISMPYFGTNIVLDMMKKHCSSLNEYNPFNANLQNIGQCKVPTLFIYSEIDDIVRSQNSEELCSKFTSFYEKMIINQNHNAPRSTQTLSEIIKKIEIQLKKFQISKKNGIVFRSFISNKSNRNKSHKKGIERSLRKQTSLSSIYDFSQPSQVHKVSLLDKMAGAKCQTPNPHSTDNFFNHTSQKDSTQYFSRKPISLSSFPHQFNQKDYNSPFIQTPRTKWEQNHYQFQREKKTSQIHQANPTNPIKKDSHQTFQNIYQMRKPYIFKNKIGKQIKRHSSPVQTQVLYNPLTNFIRQDVLSKNPNEKINGYRDGQRRPCSTSKKLNISLSKLHDLKQKNSIIQKTPKQNITDLGLNQAQFKRQEEILSSPYIMTNISTTLKSMIRPVSQCKKYQPMKPMNKTNTPTTKAPSVSSSMNNLRLLGPMKSPPKVDETRLIKQKGTRILNNHNVKLRDIDAMKERQLKKVKSTELIYYDHNLQKYGF